MQTSGLDIEQRGVAPFPSLLEQLSWADKAPLACGFGCLLGLSSPGYDLWWLAWVGLAPLLVLIQGCRTTVQSALTGAVFGIGYYLVALRWYLGLYPLRWLGLADWLGFQAAVGAWLLESFHQGLLIAGFAALVYAVPMRAGFLPYYNRPFFPYLLSVPLIWLFFQWVLGASEIFLGVPVCQLAYSQCHQLELIQIAKWGGSQLVDFVIVLFNSLIAVSLIELTGLAPRLADRVDRLSARSGCLVDASAASLILLAACLWGQAEVKRVAAATALDPLAVSLTARRPVPVAVLQGNVSIEDERLGSMSPPEIAQRYALLGRGLGAALLFLPEAVVNQKQMGPGLLLDQLRQITSIEKKEALAGLVEPLGRGLANAVELIRAPAQGEVLYIKRRLVPFGEYIPIWPLWEAIPEQVKQLFTGASKSFVPAGSAHLIDSIWGKVGASICVEVVYPRLIADEVRDGASLLINVSNLAWFHNSQLNRQLLAAAVMRAVENGRYMVLSTNTGISAVIDPAGTVTSVSLPGQKGVLLDTVQFLYKRTPFTRMWWL